MIRDNQSKKEILKENKKNIIKNGPLIILISYLFIPILYFISLLFNYKLIVFNNIIFSIVLALISILLTYLSINKIDKCKSFSYGIVFTLPFMSIINMIFCAIVISDIYCTIIISITLLCSLILVIKFLDYKLKIVSIVLAGILLFCTWFIIFVVSFFGNFGSENIIYEVKSPNHKLIAKIIDDDQGALGGSTYVGIYNNKKDINFVIVKFKQIPNIIYEGKWGEFNSMTIDWKDNKTILINDKAYSIKKTINR